MNQINAILDRFQPVVPIVLRVFIGLIFVLHGIDKFDAGISNVEGAFAGWGVPFPGISAPLAAIIEIVAGAALIAGIGTRIASALLALVMLGALLWVKADLGIISSEPMPGAELDLAMLAGVVTLMVIGPGRLSIDDKIGLDRAPAAVTPQPVGVGR